MLAAVSTSCKKEGCTDVDATNYNAKAKKDDGSCTYEEDTSHVGYHVMLAFGHNYDGVEVTASSFNQLNFTNQLGTNHSITHLEYLISNIRFYKANGDSVSISDYNLFDLSNNNSLVMALSEHVEEGSYTGIGFTMGFDESDNVSGAYSDLNVANWSWPAMLGGGYHYMKFEGKFIGSSADTLPYAYHYGTAREIAGGDTTFYNNHKFVKLNESFTVSNNAKITINMNISEWFKNPNTWDLNTYSSMLMPNFAAQILMNENASSVYSWGGIVQ